jgi:GH35 family endo-1,4-beta-xylanase
MTQEEAHVPAFARDKELDPCRVGIAGHTAEYRWSSPRAKAQDDAFGMPAAYDTCLNPGPARRRVQTHSAS